MWQLLDLLPFNAQEDHVVFHRIFLLHHNGNADAKPGRSVECVLITDINFDAEKLNKVQNGTLWGNSEQGDVMGLGF